MSDKQDNGILVCLLILAGLYAAYEVINAVVAAITALLMGLVNIALCATGIFAAYWLYRYITDKQYGETKNLRAIEKLEQQRKLHTSRLPKHLRQEADEYYKEKQSAFFDLKPRSRADVILEKTGQVFNTFKRKGSSNEATKH